MFYRWWPDPHARLSRRPEHLIHDWVEVVHSVPVVGVILSFLAQLFLEGAFGLAVGGLVVGAIVLGKRLFRL